MYPIGVKLTTSHKHILESSKKQQCVDFIISIGTNDETGIPCGYIAMPKSRRFFNKFKVPYIRTIDGKMHINVPFAVYSDLRPKINDPDLTSDKLREIIAASGKGTSELVSGMVINSTDTIIKSPSLVIPENPLINLTKVAPTSAALPSLPK